MNDGGEPPAAVGGNLAETVRLWDSVMLASADRPLPATVLQRGTVLRPPATAEAVGAAGERLGVALPPSYADFLSLSDGAYANGCGLVTEAGADGLLPAGGIGPLAAAAGDHVALWVETFAGVAPETREARADGQDVRSCAPFGDAVLLTPMADAGCDCLVPVPPGLDAGQDSRGRLGVDQAGVVDTASRVLTNGRRREGLASPARRYARKARRRTQGDSHGRQYR